MTLLALYSTIDEEGADLVEEGGNIRNKQKLPFYSGQELR
jgi:hypothetical protein